jgi:CheY-like chemotaxis protein
VRKLQLIKDPPFTNIELVSCRNVLIYLQPILQRKVLDNFNFSLNPAGLLFLGHSERIGESGDCFEPLDHKWKIYRSDEAMALFRQALQKGVPYDAILLDLTIPDGIGGKEVVHHECAPSIRRSRQWRSAGTAPTRSSPNFGASRFGLVDALKKPFRLEELTASVSQVVGHRIRKRVPQKSS